jgi:hypothetical protein
MTDCLRKLSEILNKIDASKLSPSELAKKLGMELDEFLLKIGDELSELGDSLSEPDLGQISEKFKDLLGQNIIYKTLSEAGDILSEAGDVISNAGDYLDKKISGAIDDIKSISLEDIASAPFKLAGSILSEINDQINKNICNGNILENLAGVLGDIDGTIADILANLSPSALKKLLENDKFGKLLLGLLKGTILVQSLLDNVKDAQNKQKYVAPPTDLTVNNKDVPTAVTTDLDSLSGIVTNDNIQSPINLNYNNGGPWDLEDVDVEPIFKFSCNDVFLYKANDFKNISDEELKQNASNKYTDIYDIISFFQDTTRIKNVSDVITKTEVGDYIFNIGITGDTSYDMNGDFFESEITFVYGVNKRLNVSSDDCEEFTTTKMVLINSFTFSGLGNTLDDSRYNAFLECRNKIITDIANNKQNLISIFNEQT